MPLVPYGNLLGSGPLIRRYTWQCPGGGNETVPFPFSTVELAAAGIDLSLVLVMIAPVQQLTAPGESPPGYFLDPLNPGTITLAAEPGRLYLVDFLLPHTIIR